MSASTERSWLISIIPTPRSRTRSDEHVQHLGLHHHVERGGRLVGDDQLGSAGQRHRDHHPLPLPAGELVRVGPRAGRGQPDLLEQLADPVAAPRPRRAPARAARIGSAIWSPTRCTGLSECSAPWKTIEAPAQRSARRSPQRMVSTSSPSNSTSPGHRRVWRLQPQHGAGQRRLAAAGLAGDADDLAGSTVEVDAAHARAPVPSPVR